MKIVQSVIDVATQLTSAEFGAFFYDVIGEQGGACAISGLPPSMFSDFTTPHRTLFHAVSGGPGVVRRDDITEIRDTAPTLLATGCRQGFRSAVIWLFR